MRSTLVSVSLALVAGVAGAAAPPVSDEVVVKQVEELNLSALHEIEAQKFGRAREHLLEAERRGKERGGVVAGVVLARTYLQLGAVVVMMGGDVGEAKVYFRRALCRRPGIRPGGSIDRPDVVRSFEAAKASLTNPPPECQLLAEAQQEQRAPEKRLPLRVYALDCPARDYAVAGANFVVRCAVAPQLPVVTVTLRYRPPGPSDEYAAVEMARTARGWWAAAVPGKHVDGRSLQYYVEGKNDAGRPVVRNGEATSPNVALVIFPDACSCD